MRYMLLIYDCARPDWAPAQEAKRAAVRKYAEECREHGVFIDASPLREEGTSVQVRDDESIVTDGPFAESNELLGGYFLLDCKDQDEAVEWAKKCPMATEGRIVVRPILEVPEFTNELSGAGISSVKRTRPGHGPEIGR
jgi:hypothetical protein